MIRSRRPGAVLLSLGLTAALLGGCQGAAAPTPDGRSTPGATGPAASDARTSPPGQTATRAPDASPLPTGSPATAPPAGEPLGAVAWISVADVPFGISDSISGLALATSPAIAGQLFAVGSTDDAETAGAWHSADGQSWQPIELPGADLTTAYAVTDGPAGLVIVGASFSGADAAPAIWHSADGASWQAVSGAGLGIGEMTAVAGTPGGYVALGEEFLSGELFAWTSSDGRSWSPAQSPSGIEPGAAISGLATVGDRFMAYGTSSTGQAAMWASSDGTAWQPVELPDQGGETIDEIAGGDSLVVAVGRGGDVTTTALVWVSSDGQAWQPVADTAIDGTIYGLTYWRGGFVAAGEVQQSDAEFAAAAWTSLDGRGWERSAEDASFSQGRMTDVVPVGQTVVAIGHRSEEGGDPLYGDVVPAVWIGREE